MCCLHVCFKNVRPFLIQVFFFKDEHPWKSVVGLKEFICWAAVMPLLTHLINYIHLIILKLLLLWMCCKSHFPSSSWSISHIRIDFPRYSPRSVRFSGESSNNADVTWERWALRRSRSWGECTIFKSGLPGSLAPPCGLSMSAHDWNPHLNICCPFPENPIFYYDRYFFLHYYWHISLNFAYCITSSGIQY